VSRLPVMLYSGCHKHFISHNACLIMLPDGVCSPHGRTVPKNRVKAFNFIGFICAVSCRFLWLSVWCRQFILLKVQYMNSFWLLWDLRFSRRWKFKSSQHRRLRLGLNLFRIMSNDVFCEHGGESLGSTLISWIGLSIKCVTMRVLVVRRNWGKPRKAGSCLSPSQI